MLCTSEAPDRPRTSSQSWGRGKANVLGAQNDEQSSLMASDYARREVLRAGGLTWARSLASP